MLGSTRVLRKYCGSTLTPLHSKIFNTQQWGELIPFLRFKSCTRLWDEIISWLIFFFNHRVGTSWNKENSINFCVPFVPCLGFLADCEIRTFRTVSGFGCAQYLVEHDVHTGPWCVPLLTSQVWRMAAPWKRTALCPVSWEDRLFKCPFQRYNPPMAPGGEI